MELLSEEEKTKITKHLKRRNKYIWTDANILRDIQLLNDLRMNVRSKDDWLVPNVVTLEDYLYQVGLRWYLDYTHGKP